MAAVRMVGGAQENRTILLLPVTIEPRKQDEKDGCL